MIDAELSESEAMEITGHKTRSMFDRYHITDAKRLQRSARRLEEHLNTLAGPAKTGGKDNGDRPN